MPSRELLVRSLEASGCGPTMRRIGRGWRGALVLSYGRIGDPASSEFSRAQYSATQAELDAQLGYLRRNFTLVDAADGLRDAYADDGRAVALTFDGGYRDGYDLALPVLRAHRVPATFFVATGYVDHPRVPWWDELAWIVRATARPSITVAIAGRSRTVPIDGDRERLIADLARAAEGLPVDQVDGFVADLAAAAGVPRCTPEQAGDLWMTWDEIRELRASGMLLGGHTVTRPILERCSIDRRRAEILDGIARIAEQTGDRPTSFAYPGGDSSPPSTETVAVLREGGITHAFSRAGYRASARVSDPFDLPRIAVAAGISADRFRAVTTLPRLIGPRSQPPDSAPRGLPAAAPAPGPEQEPNPQRDPAQDADSTGGAAWASSLRHGLAWSAATFIGAKALTFIAVLILARILPPSDFGLLAGVLAFLALIELGSDLGMKAAVIYEQESGVTPRVQTAFTLNLFVAGALTVVGVLISPLVAGVFGAQGHVWLFRLAALNLLLTGLGNTHDALLLRDMGFSRRIRPQVARELTRGAIAIALAVNGFGAGSLVIGHLAGTAAWCAFQWRLSPLRPNFSLNRGIARSMVGYGSQSAALEVLAVFATRIDIVVIGSALGTSALGIYSVADRLPDTLIGSLAYTVTVVAFPALARKRDEDAGGLERATLQLLRFQGLYAFPVAAATAVLSTPLILVLFGDRWRGAAPVMVALALATAVTTSTFALGDLLKAVGRQRRIVMLNLIDIPLLIVGTYFAAHHGGITAVSWVILAVELWFGMLLAACARNAMGVSWGAIGRPCLPGLATALGVAVAGGAVRLAYPADSLAALVLGGLACAVGGVVALRVLARDTFVDLRRQLADLVPARRRLPEPDAVAGPTLRSDPPAGGPMPADQPVRSFSMAEDPLQAPDGLAREPGRRGTLALAGAEAEAAALRELTGRELSARRGAAIGEARAIVDLARATGQDVATALENAATTAQQLETRVAALDHLSADQLDASTAAEARAIVGRAAAEAVTQGQVASAETERISELARTVARSNRKVIARLQRLASATAKLETRTRALSEAAAVDPRPRSDPPPAQPAGQAPAELLAAKHVALALAVAGTPREQVAQHLRDALHVDDPEQVLTEVFGPLPTSRGRH